MWDHAEMQRRSDRLFGTMAVPIGGLFALVGAGLLAWPLRSLLWPTTSGSLSEAEARVKEIVNGQERYWPHVRYAYTVRGQAYESSRYALAEFGLAHSRVETDVKALWSRQRTQGQITVRYDPAGPADSVLSVCVSPSGFVLWTFGLLFVFLGLGLASSSPRRRIVAIALGVGSAVGGIPSWVALFACWPLSWWLAATWCGCLAVSCVLALLHPSYIHADEMAALSPIPVQPRRPASRPTFPSLGTTRSGLARSGLFAAVRENRQRLLRILAIVWLVAFLLALGAGAFVSYRYKPSVPEPRLLSLVLGALVVSVSILMLAWPLVFVGAMARALWTALRAVPDVGKLVFGPYEAFAQKVNGIVAPKEQRFLFWSVPMAPSVLFSHGGTDGRLDVWTEGSGEDSVTYSRLTLSLSDPPTFRCHVYPQGLLATLGVAWARRTCPWAGPSSTISS